MPNGRLTPRSNALRGNATLGLGDVVIPVEWRQLLSLISISGVFSFGWTTGVLVKIVDKFYEVKFSSYGEHLD